MGRLNCKMMVDRSDIAILGAGFNSIYACYRMLKDGKKVTLFLDGKKFGASMNSLQWKDNIVDLGAHNLDLRTKVAKDFFSEILRDDLLVSKNAMFGSISANKITDGIEFPDFFKKQSFELNDIIKSIEGLKNKYVAPNSLEELLYNRYGDLLLPFFEEQVKRFTAGKLSDLSKNSILPLNFLSRIFFESDAKMEKCKLQSKALDNAFSVSIDSREHKFLGLNAFSMEHGYPRGGLGTFCSRAEKYLSDNGALIIPSELKKLNVKKQSIEIVDNKGNIHETDKVFSGMSTRQTFQLFSGISQTPYQFFGGTALQIFKVDLTDHKEGVSHDYLHDFSTNSDFFRASAIQIRAQKLKKGVISVEIPYDPIKEKRDWSLNRDKIWCRLKEIGFVPKDVNYLDHTVFSHDKTYMFPTIDESIIDEEITINLKENKIYTSPSFLRGRSAFIQFFENLHINDL